MKEDSKAYLRFLQGFGIGACGAMLHQYVAFAAVIIALIAFIWSCLDAQDDRKDDDQKAADKATQAPELFTKYQKILNEEDETKLRESFSFSAKDIAKFNRLFQPEKYPPLESEFSEEQDDIVPIHITKAWNPYKKRQSLCPAGTSREYLPTRRSSVPVPPFIVVSSPTVEKRTLNTTTTITTTMAKSSTTRGLKEQQLVKAAVAAAGENQEKFKSSKRKYSSGSNGGGGGNSSMTVNGAGGNNGDVALTMV